MHQHNSSNVSVDDDLDGTSAGSADDEEEEPCGLSIEERVVLKDMEQRLRQCEEQAQQKEIPKPDMHLSPLKILVAKAKSQGECFELSLRAPRRKYAASTAPALVPLPLPRPRH